MPLSFLLELHGWWHIFTGLGAYICSSISPHFHIFAKAFQDEILIKIVIALVEYLTSDEAGQPLGNRFAWPVGMIVKANVEKTLNGHSNGHANGHAKMNGNGNGTTNRKKNL
jgi:dihydroceramidase